MRTVCRLPSNDSGCWKANSYRKFSALAPVPVDITDRIDDDNEPAVDGAPLLGVGGL